MADENDEFAVVRIGDDRLVAWPRVAAIAAMVGFSLPTCPPSSLVSQI